MNSTINVTGFAKLCLLRSLKDGIEERFHAFDDLDDLKNEMKQVGTDKKPLSELLVNCKTAAKRVGEC